MRTMWGSAIRMTLATLILAGVIYPLATTGIGHLLFPAQANGSLITSHGQVVGSRLIGQYVQSPGLFWDRLSATTNAAGQADPYNAAASAGSNLAPSNEALAKEVRGAIASYRRAGTGGALPLNLLTSSGSGLDPDITPSGAYAQVTRIHRVTLVPITVLQQLIAQNRQGPTLGLFGHARVNVLTLNLALLQWEHQHGLPSSANSAG